MSWFYISLIKIDNGDFVGGLCVEADTMEDAFMRASCWPESDKSEAMALEIDPAYEVPEHLRNKLLTLKEIAQLSEDGKVAKVDAAFNLVEVVTP